MGHVPHRKEPEASFFNQWSSSPATVWALRKSSSTMQTSPTMVKSTDLSSRPQAAARMPLRKSTCISWQWLSHAFHPVYLCSNMHIHNKPIVMCYIMHIYMYIYIYTYLQLCAKKNSGIMMASTSGSKAMFETTCKANIGSEAPTPSADGGYEHLFNPSCWVSGPWNCGL